MKKLLVLFLCFLMTLSVIVPFQAVVSAEEFFSYTQDFTEMNMDDIVERNTNSGICWYDNGSYLNKTNSKYEIVEEDGNRFLKFTAADANGGGYIYINLNDDTLLDSGVVEVSFRFKIDADPTGTYSMRFFEAQSVGLLTQQDPYFYTGWGTGRTAIGNLYGSYDWNTMKYTIDLDNGTINLISNGTDYGQVNLGTESVPSSIKYFRFNPGFSSLAAGKTINVCFDDLVIKKVDPNAVPQSLSLVSSSVEDGDTEISWVNSIELNFDKDVNSESAKNITLTQNRSAVTTTVETKGSRVLVRHATLTSNAPCTLTIPTTVAAVDGSVYESETVINYTPSEEFSAVVDFENMAKEDASLTGRKGIGIDFYANHTYNNKTASKFEIVEEDGNKVMKFTADGTEGGGYLYFHLNTTLNEGKYEITLKNKVPTDPTGTYSMNFFEAQGAGLLTQQDGFFYTGWGTGRTSVGNLYQSYDWNTLKYILDLDNQTLSLVSNGTDYGQVNLGAQSVPSEVSYLRFGPIYSGLVAGKTLSAYYDDLVIKKVVEPEPEPEYYKFTQPFTNFSKSDIGIKRTNGELDYFYTNGSYNNYSSAYYDIVDDSAERGKVLKMVAAPGENEGRIFYFLGQTVSDKVKLGFKFKVEGDISNRYSYSVISSSAGTLLGVQNGTYYAGWGSGRTNLNNYTKHGEWNEIFFTLYLGTGRADVNINGTELRYVNLGASGVPATTTSINYLDFAPRFDVPAEGGTAIATYYDDIYVEELPVIVATEVATPEISITDNQENVDLIVNGISVLFAEEMNTLTFNNVKLYEGTNAEGSAVNVLITPNEEGTGFTLSSPEAKGETIYTLLIPTSVESMAGGKMASAKQVTFKTGVIEKRWFKYTENFDDALSLADAGWTTVKVDPDATVGIEDVKLKVTAPSYEEAGGDTTRIKMNFGVAKDNETGFAPKLKGTYKVEYTMQFDEVPLYNNVNMLQIYGGGDNSDGSLLVNVDMMADANRFAIKAAHSSTGAMQYGTADKTLFKNPGTPITMTYILDFDAETWKMYYNGIPALFGEQKFVTSLNKSNTPVGDDIQLRFNFSDDYGTTPTDHLYTMTFDDVTIKELNKPVVEASNILTGAAVAVDENITLEFSTPVAPDSLTEIELYEKSNAQNKIRFSTALDESGKVVTLKLQENMKAAKAYTVKIPVTVMSVDYAEADEQFINFTTKATPPSVSKIASVIKVNGAAPSGAIKANDKVDVTVTFKNETTSSQTALVIIGFFDGNGTMRSSSCGQLDIAANKESEEVAAELTVPAGVSDGYVKVFTWDSFTKLNSVCDATKIPEN